MEGRFNFAEKFRIDRMWFFFMFAAGALSILLFDAFAVRKVYSIIVSGAIIVLYAICASVVPRIRARPDQVADNSYYLGLLFTLVSLSLALYRFGENAPGADVGAPEAILRNFGIAISSTIIGLAVRVLVAQFREDPADLEHEARTALAENVRKLRADLDQASAEMQRFADGVRQALQETAVEAAKTSASVIEKSASKFEKASDKISTRMSATADKFDSQAGEIEAAAGRLTSAFETLSGRVASVRADDSLVEAAITPSLNSLTASVEQLEQKIDAEGERVDRGAAAINKVEESVESLSAAAQGLAATAVAVSSSGEAIAAVKEAFAVFAQSVSAASEAAGAFKKNLDGTAASDFTRASEALAALEAKLATIGTAAEDRVRGINQAVADLQAGLQRVREDFSLSGGTIEQVRSEMADLAGYVIKRLEAQ